MSSNNRKRSNTVPTLSASATTVTLDSPDDHGSLAATKTLSGSRNGCPNSPYGQRQTVEAIDPEKLAPDDQQYKYLVKRFNFKVVLSTFACSLVVAFTGFANNLARNNMSRVKYANGVPYNICMLLAFLAIACHAGSAVISGRGAVLCSDPDFIEEKQHTVQEFKTILSLCEHLDLHGIILFVLAVFGFSFFIFEDFVYPASFCGLSLTGVVLIFCGKYRRLSVIHKDILLLWLAIRNIHNDILLLWRAIRKILRRTYQLLQRNRLPPGI